MTRDTEAETVSPFYPPRARWWNRLFYPWFRLQRALHLEKLHCPIGFNFAQTFLSLLMPGFSFCALGRRILGLSVLAIYGVSGIAFIVWLGFFTGNMAYGLLLAAHAASVYYLLAYWMPDLEVGQKLALAGGALLVVWALLYYPVVGFCERHWALPLSVHGQPVVMRPRLSPDEIKRGEKIMYRLDATHNELVHNEAVYVEAGYGWGPVLALAGERVVFSTNAFYVNGVAEKLLPHMPTSGEVIVPEKQWFVWPEFDTRGRGNVGEARIAAMFMQLAIVSEKQLVGKPYKSWFWRKQLLK